MLFPPPLKQKCAYVFSIAIIELMALLSTKWKGTACRSRIVPSFTMPTFWFLGTLQMPQRRSQSLPTLSPPQASSLFGLLNTYLVMCPTPWNWIIYQS